MTTSVKATERRVLTADEAAAATRQGDEKEAARKQERPLTTEEEIERYRVSSEKEPSEAKWHFLLGRTYEKQGRLELAELRYRRGGELLPAGQYTGPHYVLGRVQARLNKEGEALLSLRKAVAVKPPDVEGYYLNADYREAYWLIGAIEHKRKNLGPSEEAFRLFLKYGGEKSRVVEFFPQLIAE